MRLISRECECKPIRFVSMIVNASIFVSFYSSNVSKARARALAHVHPAKDRKTATRQREWKNGKRRDKTTIKWQPRLTISIIPTVVNNFCDLLQLIYCTQTHTQSVSVADSHCDWAVGCLINTLSHCFCLFCMCVLCARRCLHRRDQKRFDSVGKIYFLIWTTARRLIEWVCVGVSVYPNQIRTQLNSSCVYIKRWQSGNYGMHKLNEMRQHRMHCTYATKLTAKRPQTGEQLDNLKWHFYSNNSRTRRDQLNCIQFSYLTRWVSVRWIALAVRCHEWCDMIVYFSFCPLCLLVCVLVLKCATMVRP